MVRPIITNGKTGIGNFGVGVMPDGTSDTLRILIKPDGFHFVLSDFEDLVLPSIVFDTPDGSKYNVSFNNDGKLLINGNELVLPTNQEDEVIGGNKTHTGLIKLEGGLQLSANEKLYEISVDEEGNLKASEVKE